MFRARAPHRLASSSACSASAILRSAKCMRADEYIGFRFVLDLPSSWKVEVDTPTSPLNAIGSASGHVARSFPGDRFDFPILLEAPMQQLPQDETLVGVE